ncbi:leucine-rich repeat domain-containing protein [Akkermansiaceae bacterium]|nr:leucine-rich repeat domain-containing protein [Akkermansiaceae bacterium]
MKSLQALLALFTCVFLPLHAADLSDLTYTTTDGKVAITGCDTAATGELVIPNTIGGNPVTSIGGNAFIGCRSLTSITIPDSVTSIGNGAFSYCSSLTSISIPDSVTSIGGGAFESCTSLTSITIGNGVTSIGDFAFSDCTSLTSITIPDSVTSFGAGAFAECDSLTSITIPDGVTRIGYSAFRDCTNLTSITIGNGVTSIGDFAFFSCTSLPSITIPDSVTSIGNYAFADSGLTSITFKGAAPTVGSDAFRGIRNATANVRHSSFGSNGSWSIFSLNYTDSILRWLDWRAINGEIIIVGSSNLVEGDLLIPNEVDGLVVTSIGNGAFAFCESLTSITIPESVTSIGNEAFSDCTSLTSITIPDSVTSIGESAFRNCSSLTSITIGNGVTSIGDFAFSDCTSLTSITIPDSVTSIGGSAFIGCSSLTSITIPDKFVLSLDFIGLGNSLADLGSEKSDILYPVFNKAVAANDTVSSNTTRIEAIEGQLALLADALTAKDAQLAAVTAERDAAITERDTRPTQAAYDAAVGTARNAGQGDVTGDPASYSLFTEDQINAMTVDPTAGRNAAGNMQVDISFIHSTDLQTFTPYAVTPELVSVVDGKITLEFPPSDENTFFYRLGVQ